MLGPCLTFAALTHQSLEISMVLVLVQFYFSFQVAAGLNSLQNTHTHNIYLKIVTYFGTNAVSYSNSLLLTFSIN